MNSKLLQTDGNYDEWVEEDIKDAYKKAAEWDEYLFGDYDYHSDWLKTNTNDIL